MSDALHRESSKLDHTDDNLDGQAAAAFGARIRKRAHELNLTPSDIARISGITKQSMTGYWTGARFCGSDKLFALADALKVGARWLINGRDSNHETPILDINDVDWSQLAEYDLKSLTDTSKGAPVRTVPVRRDWLYRRLLSTSGFWLTELPASYRELDLEEGDIVICSDLGLDGPVDNTVCIFRGDGPTPFVALYKDRFVADGSAQGPRVSRADINAGEVHPIARVHARMLAKL